MNKLLERCMYENFLRWYGHLGCVVGERLVKRVYDGVVASTGNRGRLQMRWTDALSELCRA